MSGSHVLRVHLPLSYNKQLDYIGVLIFNGQAILPHRNFANSRGLFSGFQYAEATLMRSSCRSESPW